MSEHYAAQAMSLGTSIWRQSATRLALIMAGFLILCMILLGLYLQYDITAATRDYIDEGLKDFAQEDDISSSQIETLLEEPEYFALSQAFRTDQGRIHGAVRPEVFDQPGLQTLTQDALFDAQVLTAIVFPDLDDAFLIEDLPERWRVLVTPYEQGHMAYFEPLDAPEEIVAIARQLLLIMGTVLIAVTLATGLVLGLRQQRRIDRIHNAISALADGDFSKRIAVQQPTDDLDSVGQGIDRAAERLETTFGQMRHFSQAVAHELRTPMARLRSQIETLPPSPQADEALEQSDGIIRIFESISRIARLSDGRAASVLEQVDLRDTALLMEDLYADVAAENGQSLQLALYPTQLVCADGQMLAQLTSNLVENALRHAGTGAEIVLTVTGRALTVSDTGKGVAPENQERMFTPFEQLGDRRAGTGLGLALVKAIATHLDAKLEVCGALGQGLSVTIRFPET